MTVYQHRDTITAASGVTSTITLNIRGGILKHVLVVANTSTTAFKVDLVDNKSLTVMNWAFTKGQLNDPEISIPLSGSYTLNVTNASADDTFRTCLSVEE